MNEIKMIHGIDTLYYFCESNENYDDLFLDILDQMEDIKGIFLKKDIEFENSDITININDTSLRYLGKQEGFYWFKDINEYFKIGFKDKNTNRGLNDIRVQLQGIGIYTIGVKSLIDFINSVLLKDYVTGYFPITRADLNCFIQYDFSFVTKEMFVTRKKKYSTISEIGSATTTQTIYVGKEPFLLRLYNKKEELKKSKKKDLMYEYFMNNDFDIQEDIFNIEFEIHRIHFKTFGIETIEHFFQNAVNLFRQCMQDIRLVDISNITDKDIENNSKSRAITLGIWEDIKNNFNLDEFLQTGLPLKRIKRKISIYDDLKFELEYLSLIRKAIINNLNIDNKYLDELYQKAKDSFNKTTTDKEIKKSYIEIDVIDEQGNKEEFRQLKDGQIIKPLNTMTISELSDYDLLVYIDKTSKKKHLSTRDNHIHYVAHKEALKRGLLLNINPQDALEF